MSVARRKAPYDLQPGRKIFVGESHRNIKTGKACVGRLSLVRGPVPGDGEAGQAGGPGDFEGASRRIGGRPHEAVTFCGILSSPMTMRTSLSLMTKSAGGTMKVIAYFRGFCAYPDLPSPSSLILTQVDIRTHYS